MPWATRPPRGLGPAPLTPDYRGTFVNEWPGGSFDPRRGGLIGSIGAFQGRRGGADDDLMGRLSGLQRLLARRTGMAGAEDEQTPEGAWPSWLEGGY